jgi:putative selenium metabolism protein SsnA
MIIRNAKIITGTFPNQILEGFTIEIEDGSIKAIFQDRDSFPQDDKDEIIDACGQYVLPGSICAHTHFYGAYARGMAIPGEPARDFPEILQKLWWPLDKALDENSVRFSAQVCLIDAIKHGTTTLFDHHASQNFIPGSLDLIAEEILTSGLRGALCYEVTDRDGEEKAQSGIAENIRFHKSIKTLESDGNHRLASLFGLHAGLTLSDETLSLAAKSAPDDIGFHIHVAEHSSDQDNSINKFGLRVVDRLFRFSILRSNSIIVHGVHLNDEEIKLLAESGCWVTHQPRSNMNNGVGMARVEDMIKAGIRVCLGNDGFSNQMWEEWKAAYLAHKLWHKDPRRMPADLIYQMAVINNAALASETFKTPIGSISVGARADLILVDYNTYTPLTEGNLPWQIVFGFDEGMITSTMVNGRFLMRNREIQTLDEKKITSEALGYAPKVWSKYNQILQG